MGYSVRVYCYEPTGRLRSLPVSLVSDLAGISSSNAIAIPVFSNCTIKIAQFVVEMQERKPVGVSSECYYVYRFDKNGVPDSQRYLREITAMLDARSQPQELPGVVDASGKFASRGRDWTPTYKEKTELYQAVFGDVSVPRLPKSAVRTLSPQI